MLEKSLNEKWNYLLSSSTGLCKPCKAILWVSYPIQPTDLHVIISASQQSPKSQARMSRVRLIPKSSAAHIPRAKRQMPRQGGLAARGPPAVTCPALLFYNDIASAHRSLSREFALITSVRLVWQANREVIKEPGHVALSSATHERAVPSVSDICGARAAAMLQRR